MKNIEKKYRNLSLMATIYTIVIITSFMSTVANFLSPTTNFINIYLSVICTMASTYCYEINIIRFINDILFFIANTNLYNINKIIHNYKYTHPYKSTRFLLDISITYISVILYVIKTTYISIKYESINLISFGILTYLSATLMSMIIINISSFLKLSKEIIEYTNSTNNINISGDV